MLKYELSSSSVTVRNTIFLFLNVYYFRSLIKIWFGIKNLTLGSNQRCMRSVKCAHLVRGVSCCGRSILSIGRKRNFIEFHRSFRSRSGMLLKKGDAVARQRSLAESLAACELDSDARLRLRKQDILVNCSIKVIFFKHFLLISRECTRYSR